MLSVMYCDSSLTNAACTWLNHSTCTYNSPKNDIEKIYMYIAAFMYIGKSKLGYNTSMDIGKIEGNDGAGIQIGI